jgi:hypothetical protein
MLTRYRSHHYLFPVEATEQLDTAIVEATEELVIEKTMSNLTS